MKSFNNLFIGFVMTVVVMFSSSCFDIYEKIHFNRDGSGSVEYTLDISKMLSMMEMFGNSLNQKDEDDKKAESDDKDSGDSALGVAESMEESMEEQLISLKKIPGITEVKMVQTEKPGVMTWTYTFADLKSLNQAINSGAGPDLSALGMDGGLGTGSSMNSEKEDLFVMKGKRLTRKFNKLTDEELEGLQGEDFEGAKMFFEDAHYYFEYSFEGNVKKVKGKPKHNFDQSISGKKVKLTVGFLDIMELKGNNEYQIKFK